MPRWARSLAPVAERVAHMLGHAMEGKYTLVTPLTSAKLRSAQAVVKARKTVAFGKAARDSAKQRPTAPVTLPLYSCPESWEASGYNEGYCRRAGCKGPPRSVVSRLLC